MSRPMSAGLESVVVRSPAKINLGLAVLGRRADGYHELDTTLLALDRYDQVELRRVPGEAVRLTLAGTEASQDVPADASNLAVRGALPVLELARARGRLAPGETVELRLEKSIPSRAGLGGGSSNAAAACFGAARLLGIDPGEESLVASLARVGSDCPFFLAARASGLARCTGRGERVEPLALPESERAFVVLTPDVTCSTPEVFAAWRAGKDDAPAAPGSIEQPTEQPTIDPRVVFHAPLEEARAALRNDLEAAALRSHPGLEVLRTRLEGLEGAPFRLSGSGSSFFGLFEDSRAAEAFLEGLELAGKARDHGLRAAFVARPAGAGAGV